MFRNIAMRTCLSQTNVCLELEGQKLAMKVTLSPPHHQQSATPSSVTPAPSTGGFVQSYPAFWWPFQTCEGASVNTTSPVAPETPEIEGMPFINNNSAVHLPTVEVDSATMFPLPTSGHHHS